MKHFLRDTDHKLRNVPVFLKRLARCLWRRDAASLISLADGCRAVGLLRSASLLLERSLKRELAPELAFRGRLVQATTLQYRGRHDQALSCFEGCERAAPDALWMSYALQHHAKCLVEAGLHDEAGHKLSQALEIREARGAASLVDSTRRAQEALAVLRAAT